MEILKKSQNWRTYTALAKRLITDMRGITPAEVRVREYMMNQIKETYKSSGFTQIETPRVKHIENLTSKQDGDDERPIFKILKKGDKLNLEKTKEEDDLVDGGLRYDLALPLSRYYANNTANLPSPFKALQTGSVWRADRPQRDRFRQSVQCDIDILGDTTSLAETELTLVTIAALGGICLGNGFIVRINGRGIPRGMAPYCGFPGESMDRAFITLDKIDKIGYEGMEEELLKSDYCPESISKHPDIFKNVTKDSAGVRALGQMLLEVMPANVSKDLAHIMDTVTGVAKAGFGLEFDPVLIRGMSYHTGIIFKVSVENFGGPVANDGRYDKMIGKLTGMETPACEFSIGFEHVIITLMDSGFTMPGVLASKTFFFEKGVDNARLAAVICEAMEGRKKGVRVLVAQMSKNKRFQKEQLDREGYMEFKEFYRESLEN